MPFGLSIRKIKEDKKKKNKYLQKDVKEAEEPNVEEIRDLLKRANIVPDPVEQPVAPDQNQNFDITNALYGNKIKANQEGVNEQPNLQPNTAALEPETPDAPESTKMIPQTVPKEKPSVWGRSPRKSRNIRNLFTAPKLPFSSPFKRDPARMQRVQTRWRIPGLLWIKRILAAILLLINFGIGLATIPTPQGEMGLFFWINSFILLDYLWKTRYG